MEKPKPSSGGRGREEEEEEEEEEIARERSRGMKIFVKTLKGTSFEIEAMPEDMVFPFRSDLDSSLSIPNFFVLRSLFFVIFLVRSL